MVSSLAGFGSEKKGENGVCLGSDLEVVRELLFWLCELLVELRRIEVVRALRSFLRFGYEVSFEALDKGAIEILGPYGISNTIDNGVREALKKSDRARKKERIKTSWAARKRRERIARIVLAVMNNLFIRPNKQRNRYSSLRYLPLKYRVSQPVEIGIEMKPITDRDRNRNRHLPISLPDLLSAITKNDGSV
ncbi:hypothetical protein H5410_056993 [Solanum commersonii]|uniref:Uncharacterized protein n=1 Tax=Solanum commersonii TaxID=4109 RepID=A0A9J5WLR6_SOLCO|nr:hypothetical protein H5410_056993 [Solanum commersonii]